MSNTTSIITNLINACTTLVPEYQQVEADFIKADGNVAVCIIDADGMVYGKMFGADKIKGRESFNTAWLKASQVHITGIKTGEYEKLVFTEAINDKQFGIKRCDLVGFKGGVPLILSDGTTISIGFSGFRGITDIELIERAWQAVTTSPGVDA
jgi:uncharacterized protein GlcG (DUF336 family)